MTKEVEIICHSKHSQYQTEVATVTFLAFPYRCIQELATHRTIHPSAIAGEEWQLVDTDYEAETQLVSINPFTENISRNSESSRAVPTPMLIERIMSDPYIPQWRKAQKGMQGGEQLCPGDRKKLRDSWLKHRDDCVALAEAFYLMGVCKQDISALLLPFMRVDIIATGSGMAWQNFIRLRAHQDAHPDFADYAYELEYLLQRSKPQILEPGEWHVPYGKEVTHKLFDTQAILKYSALKCARFSYKGALSKIELSVRDIVAKADKLLTDGHLSPFEHQAKAVEYHSRHNYRTLEMGWFNQRTLTEYPV